MIVFCALAVLQASVAAANVEAFRKATITRDYAWFERTLAPDYVQIFPRERIGRQAALAKFRKGLSKSPIRSLAAKVLASKPGAKELQVTATFVGTMQGMFQGRPTTVNATWKDDQRWIKTKSRWLLRSTRTYDFERTADVR